MKDMQKVQQFHQKEMDKWAKKDKDIHLQVCFKKAVDCEFPLIKASQEIKEQEMTDRIIRRTELFYNAYEHLKARLIDGISQEDQNDSSR
jgi:hypothetical protein